ncbi:hypothetical protein CYMTET_11465 [Cymbomonas tetramitiformis]|uniref:Uncharacterized protein n=1 Tax=Cymbomonas tetramitiformis TaxID=36881 RepID=A0AAE0LCU0_9CHLO|nr:hypothetical protein CYMTET_11465 [Cymbomonas tetramitiformis]
MVEDSVELKVVLLTRGDVGPTLRWNVAMGAKVFEDNVASDVGGAEMVGEGVGAVVMGAEAEVSGDEVMGAEVVGENVGEGLCETTP